MKTFIRVIALISLLSSCFETAAHEPDKEEQGTESTWSHHAPTYEVTKPYQFQPKEKRLVLNVREAKSGKFTAAKFMISIDGHNYIPEALGEGGMRFVSIHQSKKQSFVVLYARGEKTVEIPIPANAKQARISVVKGFDYRVVTKKFSTEREVTSVDVELARWNQLQDQGWFAADEHLHYERTAPKHDRDWLTMMAADDLAFSHFMVLKGGNLSGIWAQQFAYGKKGEGHDGERLIRSGEEYRDSSQGHINLLGINKVIEPISTGGLGTPKVAETYPPFIDIFEQTHQLGGIGGPAHGGKLSRSPTAIVDTVLGYVDFFEISNTHLYYLDTWYALNNCGYLTPPVAGTDLPNFPFRETWQPFLGETRTLVKVDRSRSFDSWKNQLLAGQVFVSSGPIIEFSVNGSSKTIDIKLSPASNEVTVSAKLSSPFDLTSFELIVNGQPVDAAIKKTKTDGINHWVINTIISLNSSSWIAVRGTGTPKAALFAETKIEQKTMAHSAPVLIQVNNRPLRSEQGAKFLIDQLLKQQEFYRNNGKYQTNAQRERFLKLFDQTIAQIEKDHLS